MSPRRRSSIAGTNARTSRCAPTTVRSSSRVNRSGSTSVIVPGATAPAFETTTSMSPRSWLDRLGERRDRVVVGEVERVHDGLAAVRADLGGDLLELVGTPRAERDREAGLARA